MSTFPSTVAQYRVVVGFDGSADAAAAVEWAACEAEARDSSLRVLTCWSVPAEVDYYGIGARQAESMAAVVKTAQQRHRGLVICSAATPLDPRDALISEAADADLLVLGSPEVGGAKKLLLGSVARTAARRSPCPVVVVRGSSPQPLRNIVVALDGSSASDAALDWACGEASIHHAELRVLHAWDRGIGRAEAQRIVDEAMERCRQRTTCSVIGEVIDGPPGITLTRAGRDADLLAIGSRGRSGFKTAIFGSVALWVAEHADCPVAVTHPRLRST